jgi:hypothetical protein
VAGNDEIALGSFVTAVLTTVALPLCPTGVAAREMILRFLVGEE